MKKYIIIICIFFEMLTLMASNVIEIPFYYDTERQAIFIYAELGKKKVILLLILVRICR